MIMDSNKGEMDLNPLMRLKDALEGAQKNTGKMLTKLERFERRLTDLDEKMKPIQNTTRHYTKAKENIGLTLLEIGKTTEYFRIAGEVKEVVNMGMSSETQEEFFEALGKLSNAKRFFETHLEIRSAGSILSTIDSLHTIVVVACVTEFEKLLTSSGRSITITPEGQYNITHPLTPEATKNLKMLCEMFEANRITAHFKVYQNIRIAKLKAELKQQESTYSSQWLAAQQDGPYDKSSHPFKEYFTLSYWLLRSELQLWGSTLPSNQESLEVFVNICDALISSIEKVLAPILLDEKSKIGNPVVRKSKLILVRLDVLETIIDRYEEFRDLCRPDVRHESQASLSLAHMRLTVIAACARGIEFMTSASINEGFGSGDTKKLEGISDLSSACDLHPAAGNIIYCCSEMPEYNPTYRRMRELSCSYFTSATATQKLELPPVAPGSLPADGDEFVSIVLENLLAALEERATRFDEQSKAGRQLKRQISTKGHNLYEVEDKVAEEIVLGARKHLFLCNNLFSVMNHVRDMIDKADEAINGKKRVISVSKSKQHRLAPYAKKVESRLTAEQSAFCDTVLAAMALTDADMAEFSELYNKDKGGQAKLLKAKFSTFNTGMDALLAQQGEWRVASAGLRERLSQQLVSSVLPVYTQFYSTYSVVKFSKKHMEEYLKYPPNVVERHLAGFFGRA